MGKPAARLGDTAGHVGSIAIGSTNVFIGGRPAARKGDALICPIHGAGVITQGSTSVFINGMPAARMTDITGCLTIGMSAISVPILLGPPPSPEAPPLKGILNGSPQFQGKSHEDTDNKGNGAMAIHAEGQVTDSDKDGNYDTVEGVTEAVRMRNSAYGNLGPIEGGVTHNMDVFYGNARATSRAGYGYGAGGAAEAGALKWGAGGSVAPANSNGRNPYLAGTAEGNMFHAKAEGDALLGNDGARTGLILRGEAGAEVLQGEAAGVTTSPSIFGINMQGRVKVDGSVGSAGVGIGGWLYYDHAQGRLHLGGLGKVAAAVGIKGEFNISIGREFQDTAAPPPPPPPPPPSSPSIDFFNTPGFGTGGIPGTILLGDFTVLIG